VQVNSLSKKPSVAYQVIIIILLCHCFVFSETEFKVSGTVVNKRSGPVQGVIVTLLHKQLSDTTDSDGKFIISANTTTYRSHLRSSFRQMSIPSTVSLFNVRGQLIGKFNRLPGDRTLQKSMLPVKPPSGVYVLQYNGSIKTPISRCFLEGSVSHPFSFPDDIRMGSLVKQCALGDTLYIVKKGYISKWLNITTSIDALGAIALDTSLASFTIRKPSWATKVMQYDTAIFSTEKVWDADYICDCQKIDLKADVYIQVSPIADDTLFLPQYSPRHYRVVNAWIIKDGVLQALDTAVYYPGDHHAGPDFWFTYKGTRYATYYSSLAYNGRPCANLDCMITSNAQAAEARKVCADKCPFPISCVRVNTDGAVPPFVYDLYEKGELPCVGDFLCQ
jgi:hypothetical protein